MSADGVEPDRLDGFAVFAGLTAEERAQVAERLREVTVDEGAPVATQGENAYLLFVIEEGEADVRQGGELVRTLGPGDVIGEIGLLATGTRTASVTALSPMRLVALFVSDFRRLELDTPALAAALRKTAAERVVRAPFS